MQRSESEYFALLEQWSRFIVKKVKMLQIEPIKVARKKVHPSLRSMQNRTISTFEVLSFCLVVCTALLKFLRWKDEKQEEHIPLRYTAQRAEHLKREGGTEIDALVIQLHDGHELVRVAAADALGELGERAPLAPLLVALGDEKWGVRAAAAQALGKLGAQVPTSLLTAVFKSDEEGTVRAAALHALSKAQQCIPLELLELALNDEAWLVREIATTILGKLEEGGPLALLIKAFHDKDESVRLAAVRASRFQIQKAPELFIDMSVDKGKYTRSTFVDMLRDEAILKALIHVLRDDDEQVREAAAQRLWQQGQRGKELLLAEAFLDESGIVATTADCVIEDVGEQVLATLLKSALTRIIEPFGTSQLSLLCSILERDLRKRAIDDVVTPADARKLKEMLQPVFTDGSHASLLALLDRISSSQEGKNNRTDLFCSPLNTSDTWMLQTNNTRPVHPKTLEE